MSFVQHAKEIVNLSAGGEFEGKLFSNSLADSELLNLWVHPFGNNNKPVNKPSWSSYCGARDESLYQGQKEGIPLLVLESMHEYKNLPKRLKYLGYEGNAFYFVTHAGYPTPLSQFYFHTKVFMDYIRDKKYEDIACKWNEGYCWDSLAELLTPLKESAAQYSIKMGGRDLVYVDNQDRLEGGYQQMIMDTIKDLSCKGAGRINGVTAADIELIPYFCVGNAGKELVIRGFNIDFNNPSWPNGLLRNSPLKNPLPDNFEYIRTSIIER